jgi:hypothetical protein
MSFDPTLFTPAHERAEPEAMMAAALAVTDAFTACFNARDLAGMDATLHFPHVIMSGEVLTVWDQPGQLPETFFADLTTRTGWHHSRYLERRPVLIAPRKVHLHVQYTRNAADGRALSHHDNLWIVTYDRGRWGIKQRSY